MNRLLILLYLRDDFTYGPVSSEEFVRCWNVALGSENPFCDVNDLGIELREMVEERLVVQVQGGGWCVTAQGVNLLEDSRLCSIKYFV